MTHLTLTGYYAGMPLCPVNRPEATERGEKFIHAAYAPVDKIDDLCPSCKTEFDAAMAEEASN